MANCITRHIPNTVTCCNLFCGCIASIMGFQAKYEMAILFIILGAVFDFFDGMLARLFHVSGPLGKELDSLADDITFGFAPSVIVYSLFKEVQYPDILTPFTEYIPYTAFIIAVFSALRLGKFNIDTRQSTSFIGMPTPANALFWSALVLNARQWLLETPHTEWLIMGGVLLSCWWLLAEIPMLALKFKNYGWKDNKLRYGFILLSALILLWLGWTGFWLVIVAYALVSLVNNLFNRRNVA